MLAWIGGSKTRLKHQLARKPRVQGVHLDEEEAADGGAAKRQSEHLQ